MKKIYQVLIILTLIALIPFSGYTQCKSFAKKVCKLELTPYIHDGNFNAAILTEGEDAELYKTFYAGQNYRIYICGSDALPQIEFQVLDINRNVLYDNRKSNYSKLWDFKLEASQQLIISLRVKGLEGSESEELISGCVAILFGIKEN
ncbi:MAG: hypothetical protein A2W99_09880 [Bacteroidetes bacterium GWF2_33_16]|nr:MAG: hypothetical protein A2X00_06790 [Bacteroidetes bacterium GWE2_32_14]OFY07301.1 MAG: hypothetical protein A2W99_09880 [Bacteroidetes bacterium GWF2_33_16]